MTALCSFHAIILRTCAIRVGVLTHDPDQTSDDALKKKVLVETFLVVLTEDLGEIFKLGSTAAKGVSVIGPRDTYREFAKAIGAKFLDVTNEGWSWEKNLEYLAGVVKRGDEVVFAGKFDPNLLKPGTALADEIDYLISHGYHWTADYSKLILK
jgi:hypothetical protein